MFWMFGVFIIGCGTTHLMEIITTYTPVYRLAGVIKLLTAGASVATAVALVPLVPKALLLRSPRGLEREIEERKRAQEVTQRQAALLDLAHDSIFVRDLQSRITYWNRGAEEMYGWPHPQALGQVTHQLLHAEFPQPLQEIEEQVFRTGRWEGELVHTCRDGTRLIVASRWAVQYDGEGRPQAVLEINRDITQRRRAEEALRQAHDQLEQRVQERTAELVHANNRLQESEEWCRATFDQAAVGIAHVGLDGHWLRVNQKLCAIVGYDPDELMGMTFQDITHPDDLEVDLAHVRRLLAGEINTYSMVKRYFRKDQAIVWVNLTVALVRTPEDQPRYFISVLEDITEKRKFEEAVQASEAKYRNLFENMAEEVHFWQLIRDEHGRILTWRLVDANPPALRSWGKTLERIRGKTTDVIFGPGSTEHYLPVVQKIMREGVPYSFEDYFPNLDKHFRLTSVPLGDFFITTGADITATKKAHEALRQSERSLQEASRRKDEFLMMLSHELRNPLAPVRNSLHVMNLSPGDRSSVEKARAVIERQVVHLSRMVDDLLDASRLASGQVALRLERLDLARLVRVVAEDHRPAFEQAGLSLGVQAPEVPLWVMGDPTRLTQVVGNLLQNALKFTRRGGTVDLKLRPSGDHRQAWLTVSDTGEGIEPEMLPRLFQVFAQADRSLDRSKGGLGLGLSVVKALTELHGGQVQAASAGLGKGAEFTITLPAEPEPAALSQMPATAPKAHCGLRILVVEDNRDSADSLRMLLELYGHEVTVAYTGPEGVKTAEFWRPEVILCDLGLPGLDGYGVASALRQNPSTAAARMIAVTGYDNDEDRGRSQEAGFELHLRKPVDPETLASVLLEPGIDRPRGG
jgi:PAS domain S-box-containing protein